VAETLELNFVPPYPFVGLWPQLVHFPVPKIVSRRRMLPWTKVGPTPAWPNERDGIPFFAIKLL
jgi:hypothetical protein